MGREAAPAPTCSYYLTVSSGTGTLCIFFFAAANISLSHSHGIDAGKGIRHLGNYFLRTQAGSSEGFVTTAFALPLKFVG